MITYEVTRSVYEELIRDKLKVENPVLLKTGVLGLITDYLTNIKYDLTQYYTKIFREMNPGLAQDFNSLLFHSTIYNSQIEMAQPAIFNINFIIPQIKNQNINYQIYTIEKNTSFTDVTGMKFLIPNKIEIIATPSNVTAYEYLSNEKKELIINQAPDPIIENSTVYLVNYDNCIQVDRIFYKVIVPYYELGSTFKFSKSISNYKELNVVNAWYNNSGTPINLDILRKYDSENIAKLFNIEQFDIKYYKFGSSKYDLDLFMKIFDSNISLETGDGKTGKYLTANSEIILEIRTTKGAQGNIPSTSFTLENVNTEVKTTDNKSRLFYSTLQVISTTGGKYGKNIQDLEDIRQSIFDKISYRDSLVSLNDFETYFKYNNMRPFVDSKFLDARSFITIYNRFTDNITDEVIDTLAVNDIELRIAEQPFFPTITYNNKEFISPFYYKFLSTNETEAYSVTPEIKISLVPDISLTADQVFTNQIGVSLFYDFQKNKSYFKITYGQDFDKYYEFITDDFSFTLNYANNFTWEVNTMFTDNYCIIKEPINNIVVNVRDSSNNIVAKYKNTSEIYQLQYRQTFLKYYKNEADLISDSTVDRVLNTGLASSYLDNELRSLLIDPVEIVDPIENGNLPIILKLPYLDKEYFDNIITTRWNDFYENLDSFFIVHNVQDKLTFNTRVVQTFYNTLDIPTKYIPFVFKENNNYVKNLNKYQIEIDVHLDKELFIISQDYLSLDDFLIDLKLDIVEFFKQKNGFQIKYYESELENYIYKKYNINTNYLKNVNIISPKLFVVHDSETIYYNMINSEDIQLEDVIDFCPPFFNYDLDNMKINIKY